jgi:myo-inositol-1(or 4)-monophosphatase
MAGSLKSTAKDLMTSSSYSDILSRIDKALEAARAVFSRFTPGDIEAEFKAGHDPVTEADRAVDAVLRENLLRDGEGWLSEESVDDFSRLSKKNVWVVDPLDGTREFVQGLAEFCVSIGYVENGRPVAGGIYNPATREKFLGAIERGVTYNGSPTRPSQRKTIEGALVLASRNDKLALVSAGLADITFTLTPKNEWDVVAGVALVQSAGGFASTLDNRALTANNRDPLLSGLLAGGPHLKAALLSVVEPHVQTVVAATKK